MIGTIPKPAECPVAEFLLLLEMRKLLTIMSIIMAREMLV
jgi:hypothetical protein